VAIDPAGFDRPLRPDDRHRAGGVQEGGWVVTSGFTAVIALIAAVSAATARETRDVPTSELGLKRGAAAEVRVPTSV
jgi:hypothetical protein